MANFLEKPLLAPEQVTMRPYQEEAVAAVRSEYAKGRKSTMLVIPTAGGKTLIFGKIIRRTIEKRGRALVLAHRDELIEQAVQKLDFLGVTAEIEKAESYARSRWDDPDAVVASVQTLKGKRLESWPKDFFRLIVVDECHHAPSPSYKEIFNHFSSAYRLGVTATVDRADKVGYQGIFDSIAYEKTIWELMTAPAPGPYLSRLVFCQRDISIDLRQLKTKKGDYTDEDLERILGPMIEVLANAIRDNIGSRQTIVFTPGVKSAEGLAAALRSLGIKAESISGDDEDRKIKVAKLKNGEIQVICNCAVLTEGADFPDVSAVVLCRPTKSRSLYCQMVGRGLRLAPGKENCLVIDFDFLTNKHDLVRPADLFGLDPNVSKKVRAKKDVELDMIEEVKRAEKEVARKRQLEIEAEERKVRYAFKATFDPLDYSSIIIGDNYVPPANASAKLATEKQRERLQKMGINPNGITKDQASYYIANQVQRWKLGLATAKQVNQLIKHGIEPAKARSMKIEEASEHLGRIFNRAS